MEYGGCDRPQPQENREQFEKRRNELLERRDRLLARIDALERTRVGKRDWKEFRHQFLDSFNRWNTEYDRICDGNRRVFQQRLDATLNSFEGKATSYGRAVDHGDDRKDMVMRGEGLQRLGASTWALTLPPKADIRFKFESYVNWQTFERSTVQMGDLGMNGFCITRDARDRNRILIQSQLPFTYDVGANAISQSARSLSTREAPQESPPSSPKLVPFVQQSPPASPITRDAPLPQPSVFVAKETVNESDVLRRQYKQLRVETEKLQRELSTEPNADTLRAAENAIVAEWEFLMGLNDKDRSLLTEHANVMQMRIDALREKHQDIRRQIGRLNAEKREQQERPDGTFAESLARRGVTIIAMPDNLPTGEMCQSLKAQLARFGQYLECGIYPADEGRLFFLLRHRVSKGVVQTQLIEGASFAQNEWQERIVETLRDDGHLYQRHDPYLRDSSVSDEERPYLNRIRATRFLQQIAELDKYLPVMQKAIEDGAAAAGDADLPVEKRRALLRAAEEHRTAYLVRYQDAVHEIDSDVDVSRGKFKPSVREQRSVDQTICTKEMIDERLKPHLNMLYDPVFSRKQESLEKLPPGPQPTMEIVYPDLGIAAIDRTAPINQRLELLQTQGTEVLQQLLQMRFIDRRQLSFAATPEETEMIAYHLQALNTFVAGLPSSAAMRGQTETVARILLEKCNARNAIFPCADHKEFEITFRDGKFAFSLVNLAKETDSTSFENRAPALIQQLFENGRQGKDWQATLQELNRLVPRGLSNGHGFRLYAFELVLDESGQLRSFTGKDGVRNVLTYIDGQFTTFVQVAAPPGLRNISEQTHHNYPEWNNQRKAVLEGENFLSIHRLITGDMYYLNLKEKDIDRLKLSQGDYFAPDAKTWVQMRHFPKEAFDPDAKGVERPSAALDHLGKCYVELRGGHTFTIEVVIDGKPQQWRVLREIGGSDEQVPKNYLLMLAGNPLVQTVVPRHIVEGVNHPHYADNLVLKMRRALKTFSDEQEQEKLLRQPVFAKDAPVGFIGGIDGKDDLSFKEQPNVEHLPLLLQQRGYQMVTNGEWLHDLSESQEAPITLLRANVEAMVRRGVRQFFVNLVGHGSENALLFGGKEIRASELRELFSSYPECSFVLNTIACHGGGLEKGFEDYIDPYSKTNSRVHVFTQTQGENVNITRGDKSYLLTFADDFFMRYIDAGVPLERALHLRDIAAKRYMPGLDPRQVGAMRPDPDLLYQTAMDERDKQLWHLDALWVQLEGIQKIHLDSSTFKYDRPSEGVEGLKNAREKLATKESVEIREHIVLVEDVLRTLGSVQLLERMHLGSDSKWPGNFHTPLQGRSTQEWVDATTQHLAEVRELLTEAEAKDRREIASEIRAYVQHQGDLQQERDALGSEQREGLVQFQKDLAERFTFLLGHASIFERVLNTTAEDVGVNSVPPIRTYVQSLNAVLAEPALEGVPDRQKKHMIDRLLVESGVQQIALRDWRKELGGTLHVLKCTPQGFVFEFAQMGNVEQVKASARQFRSAVPFFVEELTHAVAMPQGPDRDAMIRSVLFSMNKSVPNGLDAISGIYITEWEMLRKQCTVDALMAIERFAPKLSEAGFVLNFSNMQFLLSPVIADLPGAERIGKRTVNHYQRWIDRKERDRSRFEQTERQWFDDLAHVDVSIVQPFVGREWNVDGSNIRLRRYEREGTEEHPLVTFARRMGYTNGSRVYGVEVTRDGATERWLVLKSSNTLSHDWKDGVLVCVREGNPLDQVNIHTRHLFAESTFTSKDEASRFGSETGVIDGLPEIAKNTLAKNNALAGRMKRMMRDGAYTMEYKEDAVWVMRKDGTEVGKIPVVQKEREYNMNWSYKLDELLYRETVSFQPALLLEKLAEARAIREQERNDPAGTRTFDLPKDRPVGYIGLISQSGIDDLSTLSREDVEHLPIFLNQRGYNLVSKGSWSIDVAHTRKNSLELLRARFEELHASGLRDFMINIGSHGDTEGFSFGGDTLKAKDLVNLMADPQFKDCNFTVITIACHGGGVAAEMMKLKDAAAGTRNISVFLQTKGEYTNIAEKNGNVTFTTVYNSYFIEFINRGFGIGAAHYYADKMTKLIRPGLDPEAVKSGVDGGLKTSSVQRQDAVSGTV